MKNEAGQQIVISGAYILIGAVVGGAFLYILAGIVAVVGIALCLTIIGILFGIIVIGLAGAILIFASHYIVGVAVLGALIGLVMSFTPQAQNLKNAF